MSDKHLWFGPDELANTVISAYDALPKTGKPQGNEWTVLSGIVVSCSKRKTLRCVSLATGTKCLGTSKVSSLVYKKLQVNVEKAEVLARRGLIKLLMEQICVALHNNNSYSVMKDLLIEEEEETGLIPKKYKIKSSLNFHMYVSTAPCGDACIYSKPKESSGQANFTGAKLASDIQNREDVQALGALRIKSSHSNLRQQDKTTSMSCSDKLALWSVIGLQGSFLSQFLTCRIYLCSIVVSDSHLSECKWGHDRDTENCLASLVALRRACFGRVSHLCDNRKTKVGLSTVKFARSKQVVSGELFRSNGDMASGRRKKQPPACGYSLNWQSPPSIQMIMSKHSAANPVEVIIGATGAKQPRKAKKKRKLADQDLDMKIELASRLSKQAQFQRYTKVQELLVANFSFSDPVEKSEVYCKAKKHSAYRKHKSEVLKDSLFSSWLVADKSKFESFNLALPD